MRTWESFSNHCRLDCWSSYNDLRSLQTLLEAGDGKLCGKDILMEFAMQEGIVDIYLMKMPTIHSCQSKQDLNGSDLYWRECIKLVKAFHLVVKFGYQLALYLFMVLSNFLFILNTHLWPIRMIPGGRSTTFQVWLSSRA